MSDPNTHHRLTPRQQAFVAEYLVDRNATQAAIRAGYSKKTADQQGYRLLKKAEIKGAVAAGLAELQVRTEVTADAVVRELAKIAFLDPRRFFRPDGSLIPIHELDDGTAAALAGMDVVVAVDDEGVAARTHKIKIADKRAALVDLGKHLGLFDQKAPPGSAENPLHLLMQAVQGTALPVATAHPSDADEARS